MQCRFSGAPRLLAFGKYPEVSLAATRDLRHQAKTQRKVNHHVFLPSQGWALLRELHTITGGNTYLFPNQRDHEKLATNFGILAALKRMDYAGKMTGHGFRSLAMGVIKECLGYRHEVVDRQLSHASGDTYGEAYDRALFLDERRKIYSRSIGRTSRRSLARTLSPTAPVLAQALASSCAIRFNVSSPSSRTDS